MISALTRVGNRVLALSVPGAAQGEFYRVFTRLGETRKTLVIPAAMRWMTAATNRRLVIVSQASVESKAPHVGPRLAPLPGPGTRGVHRPDRGHANPAHVGRAGGQPCPRAHARGAAACLASTIAPVRRALYEFR